MQYEVVKTCHHGHYIMAAFMFIESLLFVHNAIFNVFEVFFFFNKLLSRSLRPLHFIQLKK